MKILPVNDKRRWYREEYLKSDHWRELREKFLRTKKECAVCLSREPLIPHHLKYRNIFDVVPDHDLMAVCNRCHKVIHQLLQDKVISRHFRKGGDAWLITRNLTRGRLIEMGVKLPISEKQAERATKWYRKDVKIPHYRKFGHRHAKKMARIEELRKLPWGKDLLRHRVYD